MFSKVCSSSASGIAPGAAAAGHFADQCRKMNVPGPRRDVLERAEHGDRAAPALTPKPGVRFDDADDTGDDDGLEEEDSNDDDDEGAS